MGFFKYFVALILLGVLYVYVKFNEVPPIPQVEDTWWGPENKRSSKEDLTTIRPFKIDISKKDQEDLKHRLQNTFPLQPPLEGVNHHYGINSQLLSEILDYWKNQYNWTERQELLNKYPHYKTNIQGLDIHYVHVKPKNVPKGVEILPILVLHGFPSTFSLYYGIAEILSTSQKGKNYVFELIIPSLPGYGFSQGAVRPGLGPLQMAHLFTNLMQRLNFEKYYIQGEDWGSLIVQIMAILTPEKIIGVHRSACFTEIVIPSAETLIGTVFPSLFFTEKEVSKIYPLKRAFELSLLEFGYLHIQATKPDTVGVAPRESPVGLAAYILEKFITATNVDFKNRPDGGLTEKFSLDALLDNIMIYWHSKSIITAVRIYAEFFNKATMELKLEKLPIKPYTACPRFENEVFPSAEYTLRKTNLNLIHIKDYSDGGHFAAFELPEIVAQDIFEFVDKVRSLGVVGDKRDDL